MQKKLTLEIIIQKYAGAKLVIFFPFNQNQNLTTIYNNLCPNYVFFFWIGKTVLQHSDVLKILINTILSRSAFYWIDFPHIVQKKKWN